MKKAIIVSKLKHAYNGINVLKELNFDVNQGMFCGVIGPNGSGKTTLVRLITGIEKMNTGQVKIMDLSLEKYTSRQLAEILAYVPQNIPINFSFTVSQIVQMGRYPHLKLLGICGANDKKIIMKSMEFTGIENLAHRMMYELSGGERQRAFIAKAICQQARIIILDEPTAALDIAYQIRIMDLMEKLVKEKKVTVFMVSHDINLAATYCDKLLLMKSGHIVKTGKPNEVLKFNILENTYGCPIIVDYGPFDNMPRVTAIPSRYYKN